MKISSRLPLMLVAALGLVLLLGLSVLRPGGKPNQKSSFPWTSLAGLGAVGIVISWTLRRRSNCSQDETRRLVCVERMKLQPGKVLHLIEVDGSRLLVSSSEKGIQLVTDLKSGGNLVELDSTEISL
ncbi:MAG: flagellar biosynthetic protein FliO [Deltaproteobacteria bacterium]|nr:flagellar biosynthetic protein FliO [Deltaproteobacteria bacterium]MBW1872277.1 flagellar biosynthetic protein FliO [Deltaproteobacteria bacterium]